jgi:hypothetical protein
MPQKMVKVLFDAVGRWLANRRLRYRHHMLSMSLHHLLPLSLRVHQPLIRNLRILRGRS